MTNDIETIDRILNGDTESFRLLVDRYERTVVRMISRITGDNHGCEDLAQDVFLTAFAKLKTFDPARSQFSTWLLTIARNRSINALKKKRPETIGRPTDRIDPATPLEAATQREAFASLDRALLSLPGKQQRAFVLVEFEGLSYEQAAQVEGTRTGTIKSRVNRAKNRLIETLRHYGANDK